MANADPHEHELIRRANRGQRDALEALYRDYKDWVYALAYRFTGDRDQALDILQETFLYWYRKFPGFTLTSSIRGFLYPAVKHLAISQARRRKRVVSLDAYRKGSDEDLQPLWRSDATDATEFEQLAARLPPRQREVIYLRYGLGFRQGEIADALDIPVGTVKSRLHKALELLRSELDSPQQKKFSKEK